MFTRGLLNVKKRRVHARSRADWRLHDIAIANIVWCMATTSGVGWGVVYCALDVQWYCNRVSNADEGGNRRMID